MHLRSLLLALVVLVTPVFAEAQVVGIDCTGDLELGAALDPVASTDTMGVIPQTNWNSTGEGVQAGTLTSLLDDLGTAHPGASVTWDFNGDGHSQNVPDASPTPIDANHKLMAGLLWDNTTSGTFSVSGLDGIFGSGRLYDIYVYADAWAIGSPPHDQSVQLDGGTPLSILMDADYSEPGPSFDDATLDGTGNYLVFRSVTGDGFTLTLLPGASAGTAWLNGIQIVGIGDPPEPPETDTIGVSLTGDLASGAGAGIAPVAPTDEMGFVPQTNWNVTGDAVTSGSRVGLDGGSGFFHAGLSATWSFDMDGHSENVVDAAPEPIDKNHKLMSGLLWDGVGTPTFAMSGLESVFGVGGAYDVLLYMDAWATGTPPPHDQSVRLNDEPAASVTLDADYSEPGAAFDDATEDGAGNLFRFSNVTGDAFTISLERGVSANAAWLNGVQVVPTPPPPKLPSLGPAALATLVATLLGLATRRLRAHEG